MAKILVIGAVALDRPVWLDGALRSGGRARGRSLDGVLAGRLGGGAANAGCALVAAGHQVLAATLLADDADGCEARRLAETAGLDLRLVRSRPGPSSRTLIFIEPTGERAIFGLDPPAILPGDRAVPGPAEHCDLRPDGLFVRAAYGGAADWAEATAGPVLLHWPAPGYRGPADVVVASADDIGGGAAELFAAAAAELGPRLRWAVVTRGAEGVEAWGPAGLLQAPAPPTLVRDATGAGDIFAAGLLDALAAGAPMERALGHACAWGAAAVQLESSAPVDAPPGTFRPFS